LLAATNSGGVSAGEAVAVIFLTILAFSFFVIMLGYLIKKVKGDDRWRQFHRRVMEARRRRKGVDLEIKHEISNLQSLCHDPGYSALDTSRFRRSVQPEILLREGKDLNHLG